MDQAIYEDSGKCVSPKLIEISAIAVESVRPSALWES